MHPHLIQTAELALVRALPDLSPLHKPGRLKGLYKKLQKAADKELHILPQITPPEMDIISDMIDRFSTSSGWTDKKRHIMTYVSFLLGITDGRYPRITAILNDISDYFERIGKTRQANYWAGDIAMKKWETIINTKEATCPNTTPASTTAR